MKNILLIMLVCVVCFVSCKKDDSPSNTDLLVQSSWKLDALGLDLDRNGTAETALPQSLPACQLDNTYTFSKNGTGIVADAGVVCGAPYPAQVPFTWTLQGNQLTANIPTLPVGTVTLTSITSASMVLWKDTTIAGLPNPPTRVIITFKH
jgi:hypothetical protein